MQSVKYCCLNHRLSAQKQITAHFVWQNATVPLRSYDTAKLTIKDPQI